MDYQEKSNLKIGVSGGGKNYLKFPWSIEDTIENLEDLKEIMKQKLIITNYHGRGEKDAEELAFDFDRAINALKENQEYHKTGMTPAEVMRMQHGYAVKMTDLEDYQRIGTLEEVWEAVEKQKEERPRQVFGTFGGEEYECKNCGSPVDHMDDYCKWCGKAQDWSEEE